MGDLAEISPGFDLKRKRVEGKSLRQVAIELFRKQSAWGLRAIWNLDRGEFPHQGEKAFGGSLEEEEITGIGTFKYADPVCLRLLDSGFDHTGIAGDRWILFFFGNPVGRTQLAKFLLRVRFLGRWSCRVDRKFGKSGAERLDGTHMAKRSFLSTHNGAEFHQSLVEQIRTRVIGDELRSELPVEFHSNGRLWIDGKSAKS